MNRREINDALRELARLHPDAEHTGYIWKNPFNPRSTGRRWTRRDLDFFREWQRLYRTNTYVPEAEDPSLRPQLSTLSHQSPPPVQPTPSDAHIQPSESNDPVTQF